MGAITEEVAYMAAVDSRLSVDFYIKVDYQEQNRRNVVSLEQQQ